MPRIELAQLLKPTTTPEQEILLNHFYSQFDNRSAANKQIINVEPLFYQGDIGGTEFLAYDATKMYICYKLGVTANTSNVITTLNAIAYNELNNTFFSFNREIIGWNVTTAVFNYVSHDFYIYNFIFSRFILVNLSYIIFNGYRVTLQ